uniref:AlNc14C650G12331 protein n=1 Tax=Albugo laibachii Nc14 TaxID=890382 RepID=F0X1M0_9STRA|nr:AlNc14C650G12331 [Albugo laibachii Nc14]CCA27747.1 AlNc14C665G12363 [Albugo laibachii Nc14]|eukprot:CCA27747.1 AlNc14C665G12363 [Albugo laibachii Nc14]
MTKFSPREFNTLWSTILDHITKHWNVGRGKRSQFAARDVFFMMLFILKNGGKWDMAARVFKVPTPTFIQTVTKFLRGATPKLYDGQVAARAHETNMPFLVTSGRTFLNFSSAMYAKDVTFQQCNQPVGNSGEKNPFYSGKHHLHGLKVEVSVNPRHFAINYTDFAKGSVAEILTWRSKTAADEGPVLALVAALCGLTHHLRDFHPTRAPPGRRLSVDEERENDRISSDRVIVENYLGGCLRYGAFAQKGTAGDKICVMTLFRCA